MMLLLEPRKALRKLTKTCRSAKFAILLPWCSGAVAWNLAYEIPYRILSLCLRPACFTTTKNYSLEVKFGLKYWAQCLICHIVAMVLWRCCLELKTAVCQQNPKCCHMFCLDFSSRALAVPQCTFLATQALLNYTCLLCGKTPWLLSLLYAVKPMTKYCLLIKKSKVT